MNLPVIFRPQARREFDDAADWYEQRRTGLGARFVAAVQQVLDEVSANPQRYSEVFGDVREGIVQGFPYCVYYREENGQIIVLAVVHATRDPSVWQSRAESLLLRRHGIVVGLVAAAELFDRPWGYQRGGPSSDPFPAGSNELLNPCLTWQMPLFRRRQQ